VEFFDPTRYVITPEGEKITTPEAAERTGHSAALSEEEPGREEDQDDGAGKDGAPGRDRRESVDRIIRYLRYLWREGVESRLMVIYYYIWT